MSLSTRNYRLALEGASTLLGKEILAALKARNFPVSYIVGVEPKGGELEPPILNIGDDPIPVVHEPSGSPAEFDFTFRAGRHAAHEEKTESAQAKRLDGEEKDGPVSSRFVIDASASGHLPPGSFLSIPLLDDSAREKLAAATAEGARCLISPHAASIALAGLMLRFAAAVEIRAISALVLISASEFGAEGIDELQKQTISLLNFAEVPRKVFGAQAAFSVSPRLGGKARRRMADLETRIHGELERLLSGQTLVPVPAVRLVHAPSFYSMALSIYVQSPHRAAAPEAEQALSGGGVEWVRSSQPSASPVDAQGSAALFLDPVIADASPVGGFWLWGRADDLRLQAENAVAIAELLIPLLDRHEAQPQKM